MLHKNNATRHLSLFVLITALLLIMASAIAAPEAYALSGDGTADNPYKISSATDWEDFVGDIRAGQSEGKYYRLENDISMELPAGTANNPFKGNFDGNGKTITAGISGSIEGAAVFNYIQDATIENLKVEGMVKGGNHVAGLVGFSLGTNTLKGNLVSATVSGGEYAGGLVGHGRTSNLTIENCMFNGTISGGSQYAGGLLGWSDTSTLKIKDAIFCGEYKGAGQFHPIAVKNKGKSITLTIDGAYYASTISPACDADHTVTNDGKPAYTNRYKRRPFL